MAGPKNDAPKRKTAGRATAKAAAAAASERDPSFARVLLGLSRERIVRETTARLEAGRRRLLAASVADLQAELELLKRAREGSETGDAEADAAVACRLEWLSSAAEADLLATRRLAVIAEKLFERPPGSWTVFGRVRATGEVPRGADVAFLRENGRPLQALEPIPVEPDGTVHRSYPESLVADLEPEGAPVLPALRVSGRIVA